MLVDLVFRATSLKLSHPFVFAISITLSLARSALCKSKFMLHNMHKTVNVTFSNRKFIIIHPYLSLCSLFVFMFSLKIPSIAGLANTIGTRVPLNESKRMRALAQTRLFATHFCCALTFFSSNSLLHSQSQFSDRPWCAHSYSLASCAKFLIVVMCTEVRKHIKNLMHLPRPLMLTALKRLRWCYNFCIKFNLIYVINLSIVAMPNSIQIEMITIFCVCVCVENKMPNWNKVNRRQFSTLAECMFKQWTIANSDCCITTTNMHRTKQFRLCRCWIVC